MKNIILILAVLGSALEADAGLNYLNALRQKSGLTPFSSESHLARAAQNHSNYMRNNHKYGHSESSSYAGFTGTSPAPRAIYAGYSSKYVGENISYGTATVKGSIDNLLSAIYHRFGFLNPVYDVVGIGINGTTYTYDMGNSGLNQLCQGQSFSGSGYYYPGVCADSTKKIEATAYQNAKQILKQRAPDIILWPAGNVGDIPPVFYGENPDPLPYSGVSGYPVSAQFNDAKFNNNITVESFTLEDADGNIQDDLVVMDKSNDPNQRFSEYQYALFPRNRLEWGSVYYSELVYNYNNSRKKLKWCFSTHSLSSEVDRFYRIENQPVANITVVSGKEYAIYIVPNNTNDTLGGASYNYTANRPEFKRIDRNTIKVKVFGSIGKYVNFTFGNGQKIKLTISSSDSASLPKKEVCQAGAYGQSDITRVNLGTNSTQNTSGPTYTYGAGGNNIAATYAQRRDTDRDGTPDIVDTDDDNDGISDVLENANRMNPLNAADASLDYDHDGFSNAVEISAGTNIRRAASKPIWTPIIVGGVVCMVPSAK